MENTSSLPSTTNPSKPERPSSAVLRALSPAFSDNNTSLWRPFVQVSAVALFLRILVMVYGELQDRYMEVQFTDVDYWVFTDAARALAAGKSPFERCTYRYTPLLAYILLPNIWLHSTFGKVLFSILDIVAGFFMFKFMTRSTNASRASILILVLWYLNLLTFTVSTRGNAESLMSVLVLAALYFVTSGQVALAGIFYGLSVHFKLYPIIYGFAILSHFLWGKSKASGSSGLGISPKKTFSTPQPQVTSKETPSPSPLKAAPHTLSPSRDNLTSSPLGLKMRKIGSKDRLVSGSPLSVSRAATFAALKKPHLAAAVSNSSLGSRIKTVIVFGLFSALSFALTTGFCYWRFGQVYLNEAILYHFGRQDHRHNFSPYFYLFYTSSVQALPPFAELITFIPQLLFFVAAGVKFGHRDLPFACFIITFVFVTFNKVVTSQYFIWYLTLFPIAFVSLKSLSWCKWFSIFVVWFLGQGLWLKMAYDLEFGDNGNFLYVWIASMVFFLANVWIAGEFIRHRLVADVIMVKPGVITQAPMTTPF